MSTPTILRKLEQQRLALIEKLLDTQAMIRGSFGVAYRKCGNPNCHCAQSKGHLMNRVTWSEDGRSRTKTLREQDVQWAREMTENYKRFRKNRQALRTLERKINEATDELEQKLINKTGSKRGYET